MIRFLVFYKPTPVTSQCAARDMCVSLRLPHSHSHWMSLFLHLLLESQTFGYCQIKSRPWQDCRYYITHLIAYKFSNVRARKTGERSHKCRWQICHRLLSSVVSSERIPALFSEGWCGLYFNHSSNLDDTQHGLESLSSLRWYEV